MTRSQTLFYVPKIILQRNGTVNVVSNVRRGKDENAYLLDAAHGEQ